MGAIVLVARGVAIRVTGLMATIVLARYLVPAQFGILVLGKTVIFGLSFLTDGGLGAELVRRAAPPRVSELRALIAFQLAVTVPCLIAATFLGVALGADAAVIAVMLVALPIAAFRSPTLIALERRLGFRPLATIEVIEVLSLAALQVAATAIGADLLTIAAAVPASAAVGLAAAAMVGPIGIMLPRWSWGDLRPLLAMGSQFQFVGIVGVARQQVIGFGTVALAGPATLGVWNVAYSVLSIPTVIYDSLWRVSFPAVSRLIAIGHDPRPEMERAIRLIAVVNGVFAVVIIGGGHAGIPYVFGEEWRGAADALPFGVLGMLLGAPVSVCLGGYLFATDQGRSVVIANTAFSAIWVGVTLATVSSLGPSAIGLGWAVAAVADSSILARAVYGSIGPVVRLVGPSVCLAVAAAAAGWLAGGTNDGWLGVATGAGTGLLAYLVPVAALRRDDLVDLVHIVQRFRAGRADPAIATRHPDSDR